MTSLKESSLPTINFQGLCWVQGWYIRAFNLPFQDQKRLPSFSRDVLLETSLSQRPCGLARLLQQSAIYNLRSKSHRIHGTGIFTYIWLIFMVNVSKYTIHGRNPQSGHNISRLTSRRIPAEVFTVFDRYLFGGPPLQPNLRRWPWMYRVYFTNITNLIFQDTRRNSSSRKKTSIHLRVRSDYGISMNRFHQVHFKETIFFPGRRCIIRPLWVMGHWVTGWWTWKSTTFNTPTDVKCVHQNGTCAVTHHEFINRVSQTFMVPSFLLLNLWREF